MNLPNQPSIINQLPSIKVTDMNATTIEITHYWETNCHDIVSLFRDAMIGMGYHPKSVADSMQALAKDYFVDHPEHDTLIGETIKE